MFYRFPCECDTIWPLVVSSLTHSTRFYQPMSFFTLTIPYLLPHIFYHYFPLSYSYYSYYFHLYCASSTFYFCIYSHTEKYVPNWHGKKLLWWTQNASMPVWNLFSIYFVALRARRAATSHRRHRWPFILPLFISNIFSISIHFHFFTHVHHFVT